MQTAESRGGMGECPHHNLIATDVFGRTQKGPSIAPCNFDPHLVSIRVSLLC